MAPTSTIKNKARSSKQSNKTGRKPPGATGGTSSGPRKSKSDGKAPPPKQVKTKPIQGPAKKKKQRVYTDKELDLPALNMITPAGVQKPRGKKKGKVFVDDQESMMTILAMVNAEKEGQIESKMVKARQMEAIREARQKDAEVRQQQKQSKLEETKTSLRRKRHHTKGDKLDTPSDRNGETVPTKTPRKRVSFA